MDEIFCSGSRFIWKNEKEMEWIRFVADLNGFIVGLQVNESEAGMYNDYEGKWDEDFIDWISSNEMVRLISERF